MKYLAIVPVLFLLTACDASRSNQASSPAYSPFAIPTPAPTPAELKGSWRSTCVPSSELGIAESMTSEIGEKTLSLQTVMSRESDCSLADVEMTTDYDVKSEVETAGSEKWQATPTLLRIKPLTSLGMSMLAITKYCGIEDWVKGETREIPLVAGTVPEGCPSATRTLSFDGDKLHVSANRLKSSAPVREPYFMRK